MDPDAVYEEIKSLVAEWNNVEHADALDLIDILNNLASNFESLDTWISEGGFLPAPWRV